MTLSRHDKTTEFLSHFGVFDRTRQGEGVGCGRAYLLRGKGAAARRLATRRLPQTSRLLVGVVKPASRLAG